MAEGIVRTFPRVDDRQQADDGGWAIPEHLIPTPLDNRRGGVVIQTERHWRFRTLLVVLALAWWTVRVTLSRIFGRRSPRLAAQKLRRIFERFGFLWVKVGQILSLRTDLFGEEFCTELSRLQYASTGFPTSVAIAQIERDLGAPIDSIFTWFDHEPLAAASIAQVHRARLSAGRRVVVKVMRPGARERFAEDLQFLRRMVGFFDLFLFFRKFRLNEAVWEIEQIALEETDYRYEASNLARFRTSLRGERVHVPRPYKAYSSINVLVMDEMPGVLMSDYNRVLIADPARAEAWLAENRIRTDSVARGLLVSFLRQMAERNLFHGDLHPGNILLLRDNQFALIDLGSLGSVERDLLRRYSLALQAYGDGEYSKGADIIFSFCPAIPPVDISSIRDEMVRAARAWEIRINIKSLSYHEKSLSSLIVALVAVMAKWGMTTTWGFLKIDRAFSTLDASLATLWPEVHYQKLLRHYFSKVSARRLEKMFEPGSIVRAAQKIDETISEIRLFVEPELRHLGQMFDRGLRKGDVLIMTITRALRLVLLGAVLYGGYILWNRWTGTDIPDLVERYTPLRHTTRTFWMVAEAILLYLFVETTRVHNTFRKHNLQISGNTSVNVTRG